MSASADSERAAAGDVPTGRRGTPWWGTIAVLLLALVVRLVVAADVRAAPDTFAPIIDGEAYLLQALRVPAGEDIADDVYFQAPLYPWLLGLVLRAGGVEGVLDAERVGDVAPALVEQALAAGRALNLALGLIAVWLVMRLGGALFSWRAALGAGVLAALYGPFVFYEGHLLKAVLSLVFLPWAVLAAARALRRGTPRDFAWCGFALGAGSLVQGHVMPLVPAGVLVLGWRALRGAGPTRRFNARSAAMLVIGAALALSPVALRNSLVAGRPVLSTAQGGAALWLCNNPDNPLGIAEHNAGIRQVPRHERDDFHAETERLTGRSMTSGEISRYWAARSLAWIAEQPTAWLAVEARKLAALCSRYESPDNTGYFLGQEVSAFLRYTPARFGVVFPLACGGALLAWRRRRSGPGGVGALAWATLLYGGVVILFCVTSRYRLPWVPLLLTFAGYLLGECLRLGAGRERLLIGGALLLGLAGARAGEASFGPFPEAERKQHEAVRYRNRGLVALRRGDLPGARRDLEYALSAAPGALMVYADLARLEWDASATRQAVADETGARAHAAAAEDWVRRMVEVGGDRWTTWYDMATLAHERGDLVGVVDALEAGRRRSDHGGRADEPWRLALADLEDAGLAAYFRGDDAQAVRLLSRHVASGAGDRDVRQHLCLALLAVAGERSDAGAAREQALQHAQWLIADEPEHDDGYGLLALSSLRQGNLVGAREAVADYDRLSAVREATGVPRRFPDQQEFESVRGQP